MSAASEVFTVSQLQARQLAGKHWLVNGTSYTFADRDPATPGLPPWKSGAEGIAYPLLGPNGGPRAYVKFFNELKVSRKRIDRAQWLTAQRVNTWAPELRGASQTWLDTRVIGAPQGISFHFTCPLAQAVPGPTWEEAKFARESGILQLDDEQRRSCVEHLVRALSVLERSRLIHGDLSPGNVIIHPAAKSDEPALYLIDFDGFFAPDGGTLARLSAGEGGTIGTSGYCPPELGQRVQQNDLSAAPYSDRFGRDALLVEFLCYDGSCAADKPASQVGRQHIAAGSKQERGAELHQLGRTLGQQHLGVWRCSREFL